jgi:succinyl-CoA:acetate CoA-transferase
MTAMPPRIESSSAAAKIMSAEAAAALIRPGDRIGMSGFTGAGHPKVVPQALARQISAANAAGQDFTVSVWTGASTAPELDGALAAVDGIELRMPYQSDPVSRAKINAGQMDYLDLHLSEVAQMVWEGFFGHLDVALIEVFGRQQQDLDRPGRPGHPRGQLVAAERAERHA